jgi:hypothetical protein
MTASKDRKKPETGEDRWVCPVIGCESHYKRTDDLHKVHFRIQHPEFKWNNKLPVAAHQRDLDGSPALAASLGSLGPANPPAVPSTPSLSTLSTTNTMANVDLSSGRGQREKKPTEKVKDTTAKKDEVASDQLVPPKYKLPEHDPKWFEQPKEIPKTYDHTKINEKTGEKFDFYKLGPQ